MAYIQTTQRLIHVKESLKKLKNVLLKWRIDDFEWVGVTEVLPEIDIYLEELRFHTRYSDSRTSEELKSMWSDKKEKLTKRNEKLSKGKKIVIRVKDIMELHDER